MIRKGALKLQQQEINELFNFFKILAHVSADMIVRDHEKSDLACLDDNMSLCLPTLPSCCVQGFRKAKMHT